MGWELNGQLIEACSCKLACPCVLGPAEPDQTWCSGALTFVIENGQSDDVDLSGRSVLWLVDLPGDFASGDGIVRLYIDDGADAKQRDELDAIFSGKKGGPGAVLASLVSKWLPTKSVNITVTRDDSLSIVFGSVGHVTLEPVKDGTGQPTYLMNAPVLGLVEIARADLARSDGSKFADPQMRGWSSGGHGSISPFSWMA